jgi:hypothetical protein
VSEHNDYDAYYRVLGLEPGATHNEIRQRRRFLMRAFHPDEQRGKDEQFKRDAEEESKKINNAADQLLKYWRTFNKAPPGTSHQPSGQQSAQGRSDAPERGEEAWQRNGQAERPAGEESQQKRPRTGGAAADREDHPSVRRTSSRSVAWGWALALSVLCILGVGLMVGKFARRATPPIQQNAVVSPLPALHPQHEGAGKPQAPAPYPISDVPVLAAASYEGRQEVRASYEELSVTIDGERAGQFMVPAAVGTVSGRPVFRFGEEYLKEQFSPSGNNPSVKILRLDSSSRFPQVIFSVYTGGAHCCSLTFIGTEDQDGKWYEFNSSLDGETSYRFVSLSGDAILLSIDNAFLYAFDCYACSTAPPRLQRLRGLKLEDVTHDQKFHDFLRHELWSLEANARERGSVRSRGYLAGWVAMKALLGELRDAWPTLLASYDRTASWTQVECGNGKVISDFSLEHAYQQCPDGKGRAIAFPEALARFLVEHGYGSPDEWRGLGFDVAGWHSPASQAIAFELAPLPHGETNAPNTTAPKAEAVTPPSSRQTTALRYQRTTCGSIIDNDSKFEWYIGPNRDTSAAEASQWAGTLTECGGRWSLPTLAQAKMLFDASVSAGTGFYHAGSHWPAHIDPIFDEIGNGAWIWVEGPSDGNTASAINLNQGIGVRLNPLGRGYTVRAFAVRPVAISPAAVPNQPLPAPASMPVVAKPSPPPSPPPPSNEKILRDFGLVGTLAAVCGFSNNPLVGNSTTYEIDNGKITVTSHEVGAVARWSVEKATTVANNSIEIMMVGIGSSDKYLVTIERNGENYRVVRSVDANTNKLLIDHGVTVSGGMPKPILTRCSK